MNNVKRKVVAGAISFVMGCSVGTIKCHASNIDKASDSGIKVTREEAIERFGLEKVENAEKIASKEYEMKNKANDEIYNKKYLISYNTGLVGDKAIYEKYKGFIDENMYENGVSNGAYLKCDITSKQLEKDWESYVSELRHPEPKYIEISVDAGKVAGINDALAGVYNPDGNAVKEDYKEIIDEELYKFCYNFYHESIVHKRMTDKEVEMEKDSINRTAHNLEKSGREYVENCVASYDRELLYRSSFELGSSDEYNLIEGNKDAVMGKSVITPFESSDFSLKNYKFSNSAYLGYCNGSDDRDKIVVANRVKTR